METTCPHCASPIEIDDESLQALDGASSMECPICGGAVPPPQTVTVVTSAAGAVSVACPTCHQGFEIGAEDIRSFGASTHFDCSACGSAILVPVAPAPTALSGSLPPKATPMPRATGRRVIAVKNTRARCRTLITLGSLAILLFGGIGIFLATRGGPSKKSVKRQVKVEISNNKFFQELIDSGATTADAFREITDIQPMGVTYIGLSKEKLTWEQAQALAKRTGSHIITIEPPQNGMRGPVLRAVAAAYPELLGTTVWGRESGEPRVIDGEDVNRVTTLDRPRRALFNWYPKRNDDARHWVRIKATDPKPKATFEVREWIMAAVEYNNPGPNPVHVVARPRISGKPSANQAFSASGPFAVGKGHVESGLGFTCEGPSEVDEVWVYMVDQVTKQPVASTLMPMRASWIPDPNVINIELISVKAPATLSAEKEIAIPVKPGQKFTIAVTVRYKAPVAMKLASNLKLKDANILPPERLAELEANHNTTWHFDTESRPGYASVSGEGELSFDLTGYAPTAAGEYLFKTNVGLFDKQTWATQVMKLYSTKLVPASE